MQVRRYRGHAEAGVVDLIYIRQRINVASQLRLSVEGLVGRSRAARAGAVVETPDGLVGQIWMETCGELPLVELIEGARNHRESGGIDRRRLEGSSANFTGRCVWIFGRRGRER